jgi:small subunit ribosomal protein S1
MVLETNLEDKKNKNEFESLLNEDFKKRDLKEGSIVKATISEIGKKYVFVDLKAKSEGIIPIQEFQIAKEVDKLKVGSSISVYLERIESFRTGEIVVSREKARRMTSWKKMEAAFKEQREVDGIITNRCKGGFVVNIDSCLCFLPGSQIDAKPLKNFDHLMNTPLKFLCVKLDDVRGNIVVSRRAVLEKSRNESLDKLLTKFKEGSIVEGQVKAILDWGAFLDLNGVDALLHVTDMSYSRVKKPGDLLSIGQTISVKIIKIDHETRRISCGIKQMHSDPYENLEKKYKVGDIYEGVVTKVVDYGAFVRLEEGLEGLVHQSELSWTKKNVHPSKLLSSSQKIKTKIIEIDSEKRRISLSYRQTLENPWNNFIKKYSVGSTVNATVKSISDFALFVSIEDTEFTGMIHYKDISWKESEESLKKFQKRSVIKAKILEIEREKEKIKLGIRQLQKDPFDYFNNKKNKEIITVTVKEVLKNGIKVSPGNEENLLITIKKSQLAKKIEDCRPEIFTPGNKIDSMIIDLDKDSRKVSLSIKELEEYNEKIAIEKYGKDGSSSGQVLGDILGKVFKSKKTKKDKKTKK